MEEIIIKWFKEHEIENYDVEDKMVQIQGFYELYFDELLDDFLAHLDSGCNFLEEERIKLLILVSNWRCNYFKTIAFDIKNNFDFIDGKVIKKNPDKKRNIDSINSYTSFVYSKVLEFNELEDSLSEQLDDVIVEYNTKSQVQKVYKLN